MNILGINSFTINSRTINVVSPPRKIQISGGRFASLSTSHPLFGPLTRGRDAEGKASRYETKQRLSETTFPAGSSQVI